MPAVLTSTSSKLPAACSSRAARAFCAQCRPVRDESGVCVFAREVQDCATVSAGSFRRVLWSQYAVATHVPRACDRVAKDYAIRDRQTVIAAAKC